MSRYPGQLDEPQSERIKGIPVDDGTILGIKIRIDPTLKEGEWFLVQQYGHYPTYPPKGSIAGPEEYGGSDYD